MFQELLLPVKPSHEILWVETQQKFAYSGHRVVNVREEKVEAGVEEERELPMYILTDWRETRMPLHRAEFHNGKSGHTILSRAPTKCRRLEWPS